MTRRILILILFLIPSLARAQGQQITVGPFSTAGLVYVCPVPSGGTPCPSPSAIFSNSALTSALANPFSMPTQTIVTFYAAGGQYTIEMPASGTQQVVGGGGGGSPSLSTTIDVASPVFGVKADVKVCFDGTVTNGSPNISSAGQCQWTSADVGKKVFVTQISSGGVTGFGTGMTSITVLPSTQLTVARISSVTDATHIVADCNAPANCVSPNASQSFTPTAAIIYGDDDTAALNSAFASWSGATGCPTLLFPRGMMFFNSALWLTLPSAATNQCTSVSIGVGSKTLNLAQAINSQGPTFKGQGPANTVFIPTPDFNYGSCTGSSLANVCITGWLSPIFEDFAIWGAGQSLNGAGAPNVVLVGCNACVMQNVVFTQWGGRSAGITGIHTVAGFSYGTNVELSAFGSNFTTGASAGLLAAGDNNQFSNSIFGFSGVLVNGSLQTSNSSFWGPNEFNNQIVDVGGTWISSGDRTINAGLNTSATPAVKVENGGFASISHFFYEPTVAANDSGISVVAGGKAVVNGWKTSVSNLTSGGNIAGKLIGWGNDFGGPLTVTGSVLNAPSEQGTVTCATSAATITYASPVTYRSNPIVMLSDRTTAGGAKTNVIGATTTTITCTGASDVVDFMVTPNPN